MKSCFLVVYCMTKGTLLLYNSFKLSAVHHAIQLNENCTVQVLAADFGNLHCRWKRSNIFKLCTNSCYSEETKRFSLLVQQGMQWCYEYDSVPQLICPVVIVYLVLQYAFLGVCFFAFFFYTRTRLWTNLNEYHENADLGRCPVILLKLDNRFSTMLAHLSLVS